MLKRKGFALFVLESQSGRRPALYIADSNIGPSLPNLKYCENLNRQHEPRQN